MSAAPKHRRSPRPVLRVEELEPRLLYSADAAVLLGLGGATDAAEMRSFEPAPAPQPSAVAAAPSAATTRTEQAHEIVFVDSRVPDAMELVDDLMRERGNGRLFEIVLLDADEDGVAQIDRVLAGEHDLAAIHILSHGASGTIGLGSTRVDAEFLATHEAAIAEWGRALQAGGDLLIYGCDVAQGDAGRAFVQQLARLAGADVAASDDPTGDAALGGNWVLEVRVGQVDTTVVLAAARQADWHGLLANSAPVLSGANNLTTIAEDPSSNPGTLVSALIAGKVTDADAGAAKGIAVTAVDNSNGVWQFTVNGGSTWIAFGTPSNTTARLLAADANTSVRFVPNADWNGTVNGGLTFRAWDQSSGFAGRTDDLTSQRTVSDQFGGGFSNNNGTDSWTTSWIKTDAGGAGASADIQMTGGQLRIRAGSTTDQIYRAANLSGATTATLGFSYTNSFVNADRVDVQVSRDGGANWTTLDSFTNTANAGSSSKSYDISSYIAVDTRIRFSVVASQEKKYLYIDDLQIAYNGGAVAAGGSTAYSTASASSGITVTAVNDAPTATITRTSYAATEKTGLMLQGTGLSIADVDAGSAAVSATLTVGSGVLNASAGSTGVTVGGNGTATLSLGGTIAQINNLLAGSAGGTLSYIDNSDNPPASTTLTLTVNDLGNSGSGGALTGSDSATLFITAVNDAPVLGGANNLTTIAEDLVNNPGTLVSALIAGKFSDVDGPGRGIAVTAVDNGNGTWQYTTNGGTTWSAFGMPSNTAARLLAADANTSVRFIPNADWNGAVAGGLTFRAWDRSGDNTAGTTVNLNGRRSVSDQFGTASYTNNDGPNSWSAGWVENDSAGGGASGGEIRIASGQLDIRASVTGDSISREVDLSGATVAKVSFDYVGSLGSVDRVDFQVSGSGGSSWTTLTSFDSSSGTGGSTSSKSFDISSYIGTNTRIRFIVGAVGGNQHLYIDNLQISYDGGATATGGSTPFSSASASASITVTPVNDAPVLAAAAPAWPTLTEDQTANSGQTVAALLGTTVTDVDAGAVQGIAVTAVANGNGRWQYSVNGAGSWSNVGTVSGASALLLRSTDSVRFVPDAMNGTTASFTYRAWDQTSGSVGTKADTTANGGSTAFSTGSNTASVTVTSVNDAPTLAGGTLAAVLEHTASPAGQSIAAIFAGKFSDVDAGSSLSGIAVVGNAAAAATQGAWQYSTNSGGNWHAVGTVADGATALALNAATLVRFVPEAHFNGTPPGLVVRALDDTYAGGFTSNATRASVNTASNGGTTAIAGSTTALATAITSVNDRPVGTSKTVTTAEDTAYAFTIADFGFTDPGDSGSTAGANSLLAVSIASLPGAGSLTVNGTAVTLGQRVSAVDIAAGRLVFVGAADANGSAYAGFTFQVQDDGGTADGGADLDATPRTMTIDVGAVNDAPVNTVPGAQSTAGDTPLVFSAANGNAISIADVDAGAGAVRLTLSVADGTLTLGRTTGLAFTSGADGSGAMSFTGTLASIDAALDGLTFNPTGGYVGSTVLSLLTDDQGNTGSGGARTAAGSVAINVAYSNFAPVLSGAANLAAIDEDAFGNAGTRVSALIAGHVSDGNADAVSGIAVTAVANQHGIWQYSTDGGSRWTAFGIASDSEARLLAADANAYVRFVPDPDWNGTIASGLTFRAWDRTSGSNGSTADTTVNGGSSAFSTATASAGITVNGVNDAPVLDAGRTPLLNPVREDAGAPSGAAGTLVSSLVGFAGSSGAIDNVTDVDGDTRLGIAVTGLDTAHGAWHFSIDGGASWTAIGSVSDASALLLAADAGTRLHFRPAADYHGTVTAAITFRAWDGSSGANGMPADTTVNGGTTAYSSATDTADITVSPVNDAPVTADRRIGIAEDTPYVFDLDDFPFGDPHDTPADALIAVRIVGLPAGGRLLLDGTAVAVGQFVSAADIEAGRLAFNPGANFNGSAGFDFQVQDGGGTADGGVDLSTARRMTIDVASVNDAPVGTDRTVTVLEDGQYVFTAASFGFTDPSDGAGATGANALQAVRIGRLPTSGSLTLAGLAVGAGDFIAVADIDAGRLRYTPPPNANGGGFANFMFQVQDDGGTVDGGIDLDAVERRMTVDVTPVNDAPAGSDRTVSAKEDTPYVFGLTDFALTDAMDASDAAGADNLAAVRITTLPVAGRLTLDGSAVGAGQFVGRADIAAGRLQFLAAPDASGVGYARFTFQVQDDGGTADGGIDLDPTPRTLTLDVLAINDAPTGADATLNAPEDTAFVLRIADFGFADAADAAGPTGANALSAVIVARLPAAGSLTLDGVAVVANQAISAADIAAGRLAFTAAPDAYGIGYASFDFALQDDGGTADGGVDWSLATWRITFDVAPVDDVPVVVTTVTTLAYTEKTAQTAVDPGLTVVDIDSAVLQGATVRISGNYAAGQDVLSFTDRAGITGSWNAATGVLTLSGSATPAAYETALRSVAYFNASDNPGTAPRTVSFTVTDGTTGSIAATRGIDVVAVNDAPVLAANAGLTVAENSLGNVITRSMLAATDVDDDASQLVYTLADAPDHGTLRLAGTALAGGGTFRQVDVDDGRLSYDHDGSETAADGFTFTVADGAGGTVSGAFQFIITPVNDNAPVITSNGGGSTAAVNVAENITAVTTVTATDADLPSQTLTFSIVGGADAARFVINANSGVLSFALAPDYEVPTDADGDNIYEVIVRVSDGSLTADQAIAVTVTPVNDNAPVITSNGGGTTATVNVAENSTTVTTVTATDADQPSQTLSFSIFGGADAAMFVIDVNTGVLRFATAPDYEVPTDADGDNVYDVVVRVSDGSLTADQAIVVTVTPVNDNAPVITSNGGGSSASISVAENSSAVTTVTATDADQPSQTLTFSIVGGADASKFAIDSSTGVLGFAAAPDYEVPTDADGDNVYDVVVRVSDGSFTADQAIAVTVTPVNDNAPVITSNDGGSNASISIAENRIAVTTVTATDADQPSQTLIFSIVGGADATQFVIDANTGVLRFAVAPDYELPTDADGDNVYDVVVRVSDGSLAADQAIAVSVTPVNDDAPIITSNGGGSSASISVPENGTAVTTVTATDADQPSQTLSFSIVGGPDAARFVIDASTGVLRFAVAPDYESPTDVDDDNVYDVIVRVSDGSLTADQAIAVSVTPFNDNAPVIASNGGGVTAAVSVAENSTAVTTVIATDADQPWQTLTFSIVGGADAARFVIDANTGVLSFAVAPDYEVPTDADGDNVYDVIIRVSDGSLTADQAIAVTVLDVAQAPVAVDQSATVAEGGTVVLNTAAGAVAAGPDAGSAIDAAHPVIVTGPSHGMLALNADGTQTYTHDGGETTSDSFTYQLHDARGALSNVAVMRLTVTPVDDAPAMTVASLEVHARQGVVLDPMRFSAHDPDDADALLAFIVTDLRNGRFERIDRPGTAITGFTQADVAAGRVRFLSTSDSEVPSFRVAASDGKAVGTAVEATIVFIRDAVAHVVDSNLVLTMPAFTSTDRDSEAERQRSRAASAVAGVSQARALVPADLLLVPARDPADPRPGFDLPAFATARQDHGSTPPRPVRLRAAVDGAEGADGLPAADYLLGMLRPQLPNGFLQTAHGLRGATSGGASAVVDEASDGPASMPLTLADAVQATGLSLTAGTVWWALRGGGLLSSLMVSLPAWRHADLLAVLPDDDGADAWGEAGDDEETRDEAAVGRVLNTSQEDRS